MVITKFVKFCIGFLIGEFMVNMVLLALASIKYLKS